MSRSPLIAARRREASQFAMEARSIKQPSSNFAFYAKTALKIGALAGAAYLSYQYYQDPEVFVETTRNLYRETKSNLRDYLEKAETFVQETYENAPTREEIGQKLANARVSLEGYYSQLTKENIVAAAETAMTKVGEFYNAAKSFGNCFLFKVCEQV